MTTHESGEINILVASGIQLGMDKEPYRTDSINAWDEIVNKAGNREHNIDVIVVAGDLFHKNVCYKDYKYDRLNEGAYVITQNEVKPLKKEIIVKLSDQKTLRIFTINTSPNKFALMANICLMCRETWKEIECYFSHGTQKIIHPFLFEKGSVCLALYGMNYVDNTELNILLKEKKVKFELPPTDKKWYKILILNQKRRTEENDNTGLDDAVLPSWMDFIVWGGNKTGTFRRRYSFNGDFDFIEPGNCVMSHNTDIKESATREVGIITVAKLTEGEENYR